MRAYLFTFQSGLTLDADSDICLVALFIAHEILMVPLLLHCGVVDFELHISPFFFDIFTFVRIVISMLFWHHDLYNILIATSFWLRSYPFYQLKDLCQWRLENAIRNTFGDRIPNALDVFTIVIGVCIKKTKLVVKTDRKIYEPKTLPEIVI